MAGDPELAAVFARGADVMAKDVLTADERGDVERVRGHFHNHELLLRVVRVIDRLAPKPVPMTDEELAQAFVRNAVDCEDGVRQLPSEPIRSDIAKLDAAVLKAAARAWRKAAEMLRERGK